MVIIQVNEKDKEKVFEILMNNGQFRGLGENRFDILENGEEIFEKLKKKGIKYKVII